MSPVRTVRLCSLALAVLAAYTIADVAGAQTPSRSDVCASASERAQRLRLAGKLTEARAGFLECSVDTCPNVIAHDCSEELEQIDRALPTIVISAKDEFGADLSVVSVAVDGKVVRTTLDGHAIDLDPGPHELRFESPGKRTALVNVVAREGEKGRVVSQTLVSSASTPGRSEGASRATPASVFIVGGLGVLSLAAATVLAISTSARYHELESSCSPNCSDDDIRGVKTRALFTDIVGGVGVVAVGVAAYLFVRDRASRHRSSMLARGAF